MAGLCKYSISRRLFQLSLLELGFYHRNRVPTIRPSRFLCKLHNRASSRRKYSLFCIGTVVIVGSVIGIKYLWSRHKKPSEKSEDLSPAKIKDHTIFKQLPIADISKRIISPTDSSNLQLILFQYATCPNCCKVRAFLDYYGFSYDIVEVHTGSLELENGIDYNNLPALLVKVDEGYLMLNDSSVITSALASYLHDKKNNLKDIVKSYPIMEYVVSVFFKRTEIANKYSLTHPRAIPEDSTTHVLEEQKWRKWVDDVLVHTLSPNVSRTYREAVQTYTWYFEIGDQHGSYSAIERWMVTHIGAYMKWIDGKKLRKRHNLKLDVRESLYDECENWMKAVKEKGTTFLGGNTPNLADLAVYGVLSSIEACDAFTDLLNHTQIGSWYKPMKQIVESHKGHVEIVS